MELSFENMRDQLAEILNISVNDVKPDTALEGSENWDSFAMLSTVAIVTQKTGKQVTLDDVSQFKKVSDFIDFLKRLKV